MALRFNGNSPVGPNPFSAQVGRVLGTATGITVQTTAMPLFARGGSRMAVHLTYGTAVGLPLGSAHPTSWAMPSVAGAIASRNRINGAGSMTGTAQSGYNIEALVTGDGGITNAPLGLIVSIAATLIASGGITSAQVDALASMVATITGSGDIAATAVGLADLGAALLGSGAITANNTALMDIAATIRGYGDLTPEGLRDAVWGALASQFNAAGSMGNKLNSAGGGGVDYTALGAAVWAALQADQNVSGSMAALVKDIPTNVWNKTLP
jgi:hypothetical protein